MINEDTYKLSEDNYVPLLTSKKQIVLGHTFNHDMKHFMGWVNRFNGKNKKTAAFTIAVDGNIYQHFDPLYYSEILGNKTLDKKSIVILLENDGWLTRDDEKKLFITWVGDIYNGPIEVVEKKWRDYVYWSPYTKKQLESAIKLVNKLCDEFSIPLMTVGHNTKIDNLDNYEGVIYRSNFDKYYTDLSPAWEFEKFKNKLELKID